MLVLPPGEEGSTPKTAADYLEAARQHPIVVHLPMTGDTGLSFRARSFAQPLAAKGVASLVLEAAYYGSRRDPASAAGGSHRDFAMHTVLDLGRQTLSIVGEAVALLGALQGEENKVVLSGMSFGGAMAALSAAASGLQASAIVATAASDGPHDPFVLGALRSSVGWPSDEAARRQITEGLKLFSIPTVFALARRARAELPPAARHPLPTYTHLYARHDRIVLPATSHRLYDAVSDLIGAGQCRRVALTGGHSYTLLAHHGAHLRAILQALGRR
jgi:hypothetical protein